MTWKRAVSLATIPYAVVFMIVGAAAVRVSSDVDWIFFLVSVVASAPLITFGNLVARREPDNIIGVLLAGAGAMLLTQGWSDVYLDAWLAEPQRLPMWTPYASLEAGTGAWMWLYVPFALIALFFPTGRLPSRRWRLVAVGVPVIALAFMLVAAMFPAPYEPPFERVPHALGVLPGSESLLLGVLFTLLAVFMMLLVASAAALRVRYRRADAVARAQLKWFALAGMTVPGTLLLCWVSYLLMGNADLVIYGLVAMFFGIPAATTVAILRYDLFDVDRVLSTAVTYSLVTAGLLSVFGVASFLLGLAVADSQIATAAATAAAALALQPLRGALQGGINRRLYPLRQGALSAISDLRRQAASGEREPEELEQVLRDALHDPRLMVGYRAPGSSAFVDAAGRPVPRGAAAVPVRSGSQEIGLLVPGRTLPAALANEVAAAASTLVEIVTVRLELGRVLGEVDASRARLLRTGYAERRRLERDLHDGAQRRLDALSATLRAARQGLGDDGTNGTDIRGLFDEAVVELATAVAELRLVANGVRPSALDDGLDHALAVLTSKAPVPIEMDVAAVDLDDATATTAYLVAAEAVTNAVKHAQAQRIALQVAQRDDHVEVRVHDDGRGGAVLQPGSGLAGVKDRVAALGGWLKVTSGGGGTEVRAVLPCAS